MLVDKQNRFIWSKRKFPFSNNSMIWGYILFRTTSNNRTYWWRMLLNALLIIKPKWRDHSSISNQGLIIFEIDIPTVKTPQAHKFLLDEQAVNNRESGLEIDRHSPKLIILKSKYCLINCKCLGFTQLCTWWTGCKQSWEWPWGRCEQFHLAGSLVLVTPHPRSSWDFKC